MKIKITNNAYNDLKEFKSISKSTNTSEYILSLLDYTKSLSTFPELGKYEFTLVTNLNKYNIRKLIYEQHKILYYIGDSIHIVGFVHTKQDINKYIKNLKNFIEF